MHASQGDTAKTCSAVRPGSAGNSEPGKGEPCRTEEIPPGVDEARGPEGLTRRWMAGSGRVMRRRACRIRPSVRVRGFRFPPNVIIVAVR